MFKIFFFILHTVVLICCQAAVADLITDLGSNVIINCDLDENYVYWILLKTADPPTVILQSFSTSSFYPNKSFRKKYSVQFKHRLVINNVTADELGFYYCVRPGSIDPMTAVVQRVKAFAYYSLSFFHNTTRLNGTLFLIYFISLFHLTP